MEIKANLARLGMFFGNKTPQAFVRSYPDLCKFIQIQTNFVPSVSVTGDLAAHLIVQAKPIDAFLDGGSQTQQLINVECTSDFYTLPQMRLTFTLVVQYTMGTVCFQT